jgi:far upstream element-binding protein
LQSTSSLSWSQYPDQNAAAWAAYYQQYYTANAPATNQIAPTPSSAIPGTTPSNTQPDYTQAWVDYYRSLGMHDQAEQILKQTQTNQSKDENASNVTRSDD